MPKIDTGDTTFVLMSTALVMLMTPGLAFFYGGLVRRKSALNTMMMSFIAMAFITVAWMLVGYSLAFAPGPEGLESLIGGLAYLGLQGVGGEPNPDLAETIPHASFMLFQGMFAIITPALISGAVAERMKFKAFVLFSIAWSVLVYAPVCHWVWGPGGWIGELGALDFAGGAVVHINAGVAALVAAVVLGPRKGFQKTAMLPHNVPFVLLGTGLLWFGWLGFNGGSALQANGLAASAFVTTVAAAAVAALVWSVLEQWAHGKMSGVGFASGAVAGLVGITPAAGFVTPIGAMLIGVGASGVAFGAVQLKSKIGLDDALDVFGIHGMAGLFGALATGALATTAVNPDGADGSLSLVMTQLVASLAVVAYSGLLSLGILKAVGAVVGLRVDETTEQEGIDLAEHGESAYAEGVLAGTIVEPKPSEKLAGSPVPVEQSA